jgi:molybdopterin converting factor small subunit
VAADGGFPWWYRGDSSTVSEGTVAPVKVNLYATLRKYVGGAPSVEVEIEPGQTVAEVLARLGVPADQTRIIFINNRAAGLSHVLQGGERLGVFPAIGGG